MGVSPSSSVAVALQVRYVAVSTPESGLMVTEVTSGSELSTETESVPVSVPPSSSVAVAVQVMVSLGELLEEESVTVLPVPRAVPSVELVQA